jgi:hypothetical protein
VKLISQIVLLFIVQPPKQAPAKGKTSTAPAKKKDAGAGSGGGKAKKKVIHIFLCV